MKTGTWQKAELRLQTVEEEADRLGQTREFSDHQRSWHNALNGLHSAMEAFKDGSKTSPRGGAWFSKVFERSRESPLLSYLHAARCEEHHNTVGVSLGLRPAQVKLPSDGRTVTVSRHIRTELTPHGGIKRVVTPFQLEGSGELKSEQPEPVSVVYKGARYEAPLIHDGRVLADTSARGVLLAALTQMRIYVDECSDIENETYGERSAR